MYSNTPVMENFWINSTDIDPAVAGLDDCFTTLPVRLSKGDDAANAGSMQAIKDWAQVMGNSDDVKLGQTFSPVGNVSSLLWPECPSEKLGIMSWVNQFAYIYDDFTEIEPADREIFIEKKQKLKKLLAKKVLEMVDLQSEAGRLFLKSFQEWAERGHESEPGILDTFEQYMDFRYHNSGMKVYWDWIAYSSGYNLAPTEWASIKDLLKTATGIYILTNDYFSWRRETFHTMEDAVNVVGLYMKRDGLTDTDARLKTRRMILKYESMYRAQCATAFAQPYGVSFPVQAVLELVAVSMGGYHYWAAACPRFNFWKQPGQTPDAPFEQPVEVKSFTPECHVEKKENITLTTSCVPPVRSSRGRMVLTRYSNLLTGYRTRAIGKLKVFQF